MLTKDLLALKNITEEPDTISKIPEGSYCYTILSIDEKTGLIKTNCCPYLYHADDQHYQENGYCSLMKHGDWMGDSLTLLWDSVKECGHNDGLAEE